MRSFVIEPSGPFSLREAAEFGFGQRHAATFDGVMRLAFVVDGYVEQVGVELRQSMLDGPVTALVLGEAPLPAVQQQVARVLSLDHDAEAFARLGESDPVLARLQSKAHGLRPPLFHSAYEAAAWSIISARRSAAQMGAVRDALSYAHGATFGLAGQECSAFPTPGQLLGVNTFPGLQKEKIERLHGVAEAAAGGLLDNESLAAMGPEAATAALLSIKGIGPFYASLIVIRALGYTDVPVTDEPKAMALMGELYGLAGPATPAQASELAQAWRPYRTWATVLIRAAGPRVLAER